MENKFLHEQVFTYAKCNHIESLQVGGCAGHQAGEMGTVARGPEQVDRAQHMSAHATCVDTTEQAPYTFLFPESAEFIRCAQQTLHVHNVLVFVVRYMQCRFT